MNRIEKKLNEISASYYGEALINKLVEFASYYPYIFYDPIDEIITETLRLAGVVIPGQYASGIVQAMRSGDYKEAMRIALWLLGDMSEDGWTTMGSALVEKMKAAAEE